MEKIVSKPSAKRILLVEDNPFNQKVTAMMFSDIGYTNIDLAESGKGALRLCKKNHYDLILLDIGLPDISGIEVASRLRQYEDSHHQLHTPVIALTIQSLEEDKAKALAAGIDAYLVKPLMLKQLRKLCKEKL
jgi:CheY-like chemotaxis protein